MRPQGLVGSLPDGLDNGYTGHEMLDGLGLVHMNGRIYDPVIGKFLSPDSIVQAPGNIQNYNRYSYVGNNPLSYTDPSGHIITLLVGFILVASGVAAEQMVVAAIIMFVFAAAEAYIMGARGSDVFKGTRNGSMFTYPYFC